VDTDPGWRDKLAGVDLVAMHPDAPLTHRLGEDGGWREVYRDPFAVLFERAARPR
jgi:hypothetical protein